MKSSAGKLEALPVVMPPRKVLRVFIGHDGKEAVATDVCEASMRMHATVPLQIHHLKEPLLRHSGIYWRTWKMMGNQRVDAKDGRPFSTLFAFTRFLVPALVQYDGWALFVDADFLFLDDVANIFALADDRYAVQVVKRGTMETGAIKMDGQAQVSYPKKNWSSLMLFNCAHAANRTLTLQQVNNASGLWLHQLSWLEDSEIGDLPPLWNWLSRVDAMPDGEEPRAIHFTLGIPDMPGYEDSPYADHWRAVKDAL